LEKSELPPIKIARSDTDSFSSGLIDQVALHTRVQDKNSDVQDDPKKQYEKAQADHLKKLDGFWDEANRDKKSGKWVDEFPPIYDGPAKPAGYDRPRPPSTLPNVDQMIHGSKNLERYASGDLSKNDFKLRQVSESDFKDAYVREALHVGGELKLSKAEVQRVVMSIYAFENGGKGTHDLMSGVPLSLTRPDAPGSHANFDARRKINPLSSAIGYNQIIMSTNLAFYDTQGNVIAARIKDIAKDENDPNRRQELVAKARLIEDLQKTLHANLMEMANKDAVSKAKYLKADGSPQYALYADYAKSGVATKAGVTGRQFASAMHALNLDGDVGPIVQSRQLREVLLHSLDPNTKTQLQVKASHDRQSALVFDGLPPASRNKAIAEVFAAAKIQAEPGMLALQAKVQKIANDRSAVLGDRPDLRAQNLPENERKFFAAKIAGLKAAGENEDGKPLSPAARLLVAKLNFEYFGHPTGTSYLGAAVELANLAGQDQATRMLQPANRDKTTVNFFDRKGYEGNPIVQRRTADELLKAIHRSMRGPGSDASNWGNAEFVKAWARH
jgi:hypothetical protein